MTSQELKEVKLKLPSGAMTVIAKNSGLHYSLISRVLSGKRVSLDQNTNVLNAVAEYLEKLNKAEKEATDRVKAVMTGNLQTA